MQRLGNSEMTMGLSNNLDFDVNNDQDRFMKVLSSIFRSLGRLFLQPIFLILLLILVSAGGVYLFTENRTIGDQLSQLRDDPDAAAREEIEDLVAQVAKLTEVPEGEQPTIATVTDVESIKDQSFFQNAQNGDRVLIYAEARRAILFRPETGKIVEVAPINIGQTEGLDQDQEGTGEAMEGEVMEKEVPEVSTGPVKLAFSNGTSTAGLTVNASDTVIETLSDLEIDVVSRIDAKGDFDTTTVVVLTEGYEAVAELIAGAVGGTVGDLPEGEVIPDADVLVILGANYVTE